MSDISVTLQVDCDLNYYMEGVYGQLTDNELLSILSFADGCRAVYVTEKMIVQTANPAMLRFWNKDHSVLGKALSDIYDESLGSYLESEEHRLFLENIWRTGKNYNFKNIKKTLLVNDYPKDYCFNVSYQPFKNTDGNVYAILHTALDVTELNTLQSVLEGIAEPEQDSQESKPSHDLFSEKDKTGLVHTEHVSDRSKESERNLRSLVRSTHFALMVLTGPNWIVEVINKPMATLMESRIEKMNGRPLLEVLPEISDHSFSLILERVYSFGICCQEKEQLFLIQTPSGPITKYVSFYYDAMFNADGKVSGIMVSAEDRTENVQNRLVIEKNYLHQTILIDKLYTSNENLETANSKLVELNQHIYIKKEHLKILVNELESSESKFKRLVDQAPVGICILTGPDFIIECANKLMLELLNKSDEILNFSILSTLPGLYEQGFIELLAQVYSTGISYTGHESKVELDYFGELREYYVDFIFEPLKSNEGVTTSIMVVVTDVTSDVLARNEFQKDQELLRFSIMAANIGTWSVDLKTGESSIASKNKELFGFLETEEVSPDQLMEQITPEFKDKVQHELNKVIAEGGICDITYSAIGFHDQKLRWVRTIAGVVNDKNGIPSFTSGISIETTQQKQDELRKNQFISIVSHELKTPLTTIQGYIQLAIQRADQIEEPFISKILDKANSRVDKVTAIINGFLNVSQLEIGRIRLLNQAFIVEELIREVSDEANILSKEKRVKFVHEGLTNIYADRNKIEQVITNLISNAKKYSPAESPIFIECHSDEHRVTIKVKDSGRGINPEDQDRIFEKYFRVESQQNQIISGFGIGLYLCKEIIDRHNGRLWVESFPEKGSEFIFHLPLN